MASTLILVADNQYGNSCNGIKLSQINKRISIWKQYGMEFLMMGLAGWGKQGVLKFVGLHNWRWQIKVYQQQVLDSLQLLPSSMWLIDIGVAVAPIIGYYSQLQLIRKQKSIGTFSIDVCAILMISAILRIYFWITNGYAINLLFQAMFVIIIQAMLLNECIEMSPRPKDLGEEERFWRWNTFDQYIKFLLMFTAGVGVVTFMSKIIWIPFYGTLLGFASMSIEATLGLPQLMSNYRTKSVQGLSFFMIFTWFAGDFLKTLYFIIELQPVQFILCGSVQLLVDITIIGQIINYKKVDNKLYNPVAEEQKQSNKYEVNEDLGS